MRTMRGRPFEEKLRVERKAAARRRFELDHPSVEPVRIELVVDHAVQRVREVNALAVAAHFDHLRSAVQRIAARARVRRARHDAADAYRARQLRMEWVR